VAGVEPQASPQNHPKTPSSGRIAGIDYGTVRIGIALTDAGRTIASPYENYTRSGSEADVRRFRRLVKEEDIRLFVVGLPVHLDGNESQKSSEARRFGSWLEESVGIPVVYYDERFTSVAAEAHLQAAQLTKKRRKARLDMLAAQIMLTAYLESRHKGEAPPLALDD